MGDGVFQCQRVRHTRQCDLDSRAVVNLPRQEHLSRNHGDPGLGVPGRSRDARDDLAAQGLVIEPAFARDHPVRVRKFLPQTVLRDDFIDPRNQAAVQKGDRPGGQPPAAPAPGKSFIFIPN